MQRYIKKIRIISAILLSIEIILLAFLVSLYFFDFIEGSKTFIENNYLIIVAGAFFLLVDWIYFTCIFHRLKKIRYKNNLSTPLMNNLLVFDGLKSEFRTLNYAKNDFCETCSSMEY